MPEIESAELSQTFIENITGGKSEQGTGGMSSKLQMAGEAARFGIETRIIDGTRSKLIDQYYDRNYE